MTHILVMAEFLETSNKEVGKHHSMDISTMDTNTVLHEQLLASLYYVVHPHRFSIQFTRIPGPWKIPGPEIPNIRTILMITPTHQGQSAIPAIQPPHESRISTRSSTTCPCQKESFPFLSNGQNCTNLMFKTFPRHIVNNSEHIHGTTALTTHKTSCPPSTSNIEAPQLSAQSSMEQVASSSRTITTPPQTARLMLP
jgi:hypothetical protein